MPATKSASADGESRLSIAAAISGGHVRQQLHRLAGALAQQIDAGFDLRCQHLGGGDLLDPRHQERVAGNELDTRKRRIALADDMMGAVGGGDIAQHSATVPNRCSCSGLGSSTGRIGLQQRLPAGAARGRPAERRRSTAAARRQAAASMRGEQHGLANRQDDEGVLRNWRVASARLGLRFCWLRCVWHGHHPMSNALDQDQDETSVEQLGSVESEAGSPKCGCGARSGRGEFPGDEWRSPGAGGGR